MAAAPAAPEILVLTDLLIGFVFIVTAVILMGLLWSYRNTFHWLFQKVAGFKVAIPWVGASIHPLSVFADIDGFFIQQLSDAAASQQRLAGRFFHAAGIIQGWIVRELRDFAVRSWKWANWLQRVHLPVWVKALIYAAIPPLLLPRIIKALGGVDVRALWRKLTHLEQTLHHAVIHLIKKYAKYAVPIPLGLPWAIGEVTKLWKWRTATARQLKGLRWIAAFTGVAALGLAILERLGLKWLKCGNVGKAGKAICRTDGGLLNELLGDTLALVGVISVVEFAHGMLAIEDEAVKILSLGIREFPG